MLSVLHRPPRDEYFLVLEDDGDSGTYPSGIQVVRSMTAQELPCLTVQCKVDNRLPVDAIGCLKPFSKVRN